jgi:hypothetical protein
MTENVKHVEVLQAMLRDRRDFSSMRLTDVEQKALAAAITWAALQREAAGDGEGVAWLITWNDGSRQVSFDRCHADDGTCEPLVLRYTAPRPTGAAGLTQQEAEWLEYAINHMHDNSEPEDKTCADVLHSLFNRLRGNITLTTPASAEPGEAMCDDCDGSGKQFGDGGSSFLLCETCGGNGKANPDARGGGEAAEQAQRWHERANELARTDSEYDHGKAAAFHHCASVIKRWAHPTPAALDAARATLLRVIADEKSEWTGDLRTAAHKALDDLLTKFDAARATTGGQP